MRADADSQFPLPGITAEMPGFPSAAAAFSTRNIAEMILSKNFNTVRFLDVPPGEVVQ